MWPRRLLTALCVLTLTACAPSAPAPTEAPFYAPDFTLSALDGDPVTLRDLRGRWAIVNFWATWCVPCVAEMPALNAVGASFADRVTVLGINMRESAEAVRAFAQQHAIDFPLLLDPPDSVVLDYQVIGLPQTLVIDPAGVVVWRRFGPVDLASFEAELRRLMADF